MEVELSDDPKKEGEEEEEPAYIDLDKKFGFKTKNTRKWVNRQRTLVLSSRRVNKFMRLFLKDIQRLLVHSKKEAKLEKNDVKMQLEELCMVHSCQNLIYLEQQRQNVYLWFSKAPKGPTVKFKLHNIHCTTDIKMQGNCLQGSRAIVSFDGRFDQADQPEW